MAPIVTMYKGYRFRSRLEARWAAFFDLLEWRWEYEPCDFEGWIPDFALCEAISTYVEVKPILRFDASIAKKLTDSRCMHDLLLVGATLLVEGDGCPKEENRRFLGWLAEYGGDRHPGRHAWGHAAVGIWRTPLHVEARHGFCHDICHFTDRINGGYDGRCWGALPCDAAHIDRLWAEAGNIVQWRPRRYRD